MLAGAFVVSSVSNADAALMAWVCTTSDCSAGGDIFVTDQLAGDLSGIAGRIKIEFGSDSVEIATSYPALGSETNPILSLSYDFSDVPSPLYIYAQQDGFTKVGGAYFEADSSLGGGSATAYAGTGTFAPPGSGADIIGGPGTLDFTAFGSSPTSTPYYLAIGLKVTTVSGATTGDASLTVPDGGATAGLLGLALMTLGYMRRRFA